MWREVITTFILMRKWLLNMLGNFVLFQQAEAGGVRAGGFRHMNFSNQELQELGRAWLLLSIAFAILFAGFSLDLKFAFAVLISGFTAGIGFLLHEIAHKFVAQKFHCKAEFHAFDKMLWIAVLLSFFGFIFAAPGAVFISGRINAKKNGLISLAGPLTNVIIGLFFAVLFVAIPIQAIKSISLIGIRINFWLALFNMLPFFGLDGTKVLLWDKRVYATVLIVCILLVFGTSF